MLEPTKTLEEMLRAILEAQVRGGCEKYLFLIDGATLGAHQIRFSEALEILDTGYCACGARSRYILEILLDTDGLKAAYGEDLTFKLDVSHKPAGQTAEVSFRDELPRWRFVAASIANTWHSGPGNNIQAAIETAYKLLPPKV